MHLTIFTHHTDKSCFLFKSYNCLLNQFRWKLNWFSFCKNTVFKTAMSFFFVIALWNMMIVTHIFNAYYKLNWIWNLISVNNLLIRAIANAHIIHVTKNILQHFMLTLKIDFTFFFSVLKITMQIVKIVWKETFNMKEKNILYLL